MSTQHAVAAIERARIGIAAKLSGRSFDDETAAKTATVITDALQADGWRGPGMPDSQPPAYRRPDPTRAADPNAVHVAAETIRADLAARRQRRVEDEAQAQAAREGGTDG